MRLRRLHIRSLPGIEPGFVFEPADAGINVVTGPNAVGKSSLARALGYLLAAVKSDPPALSLEADFESADARWQVQRNGSQVSWRRDGEAASRPALPSADQIGHYRLSIETLLDEDDVNDEALAERLRRELHGNFDLASLKADIGPRFARREAKALEDTRRGLRAVESAYASLHRNEAGLPELERRIDEARKARTRCERLEQGLKLADAVDSRKQNEAALSLFPPDMERLRGDESERLERAHDKLRGLGEEVREQERIRGRAEAALEETGLSRARPSPEATRVLSGRLRTIAQLCSERRSARELVVQADAEMRDTLARFNDAGTPPVLDSESFRRVEETVPALVSARTRLRELQEQLSLAGEAPDASDIERHREAAEALRAWLAAKAGARAQTGGPSKWAWAAIWVALAGAGLAALAAFVQGALFALAAALVTLVASGLALFMQRASRMRSAPPGDEAKRRFRGTGITPPSRWDEESVRRHLRDEVEARLNDLVLRRQRAAGRERFALQIEETERKRAELEEDRASTASEIGFDPAEPVLELHRFVHSCAAWDEARQKHARNSASLVRLEEEIAAAMRDARNALSPWRKEGAPSLDGGVEQPDVDLLHGAFDSLQQRMEEVRSAQNEIRNCETALQSLLRQVADAEEESRNVFVQAGLEPGAASELGGRLEQVEAWKVASDALARARTEEELLRAGLGEHPDVLALVDEEQREDVQSELTALARRADEYTDLIAQRSGVQTRLEDAGRNRELERAAAAEVRAEQDLADKREEALLAAATETILTDVEEAFVAEHEPAVLRRARDIFAQVTARSFELELRRDGAFVARDLRQGATRTLGELSSGTRAQLLLALRLAWTEAQEEGRESLPLFLDEALTTSDEERFAVMARSLERIATAEGRPRQVFYLSARRHESVLWKQATGSEPATVDLALLRFRRPSAAPADYRFETAPALPAPEGRSAETYASLLGVPRLDPFRPEGDIHLYYLLRDELALLHRLMDSWRISSAGQLEALLASDAAPVAVAGEDVRDRLRGRCRALRTWVDLWRQGRGRPVDRAALEQCGGVSAVFIDRVAELAERCGGDGESLVQALRDGELEYFRTNKIEELERDLIDEGYIDPRDRLGTEARRRLTLQTAPPGSPEGAGDLGRMLDWLEGAARGAYGQA